MASPEFRFIEIGIYFCGGVLAMVSSWAFVALIEYFSAPDKWDF